MVSVKVWLWKPRDREKSKNVDSFKNPSQGEYLKCSLYRRKMHGYPCFGNPLRTPSNLFHIS